jgi:arylsulfatase A-like enzyme
MFVGLGVTASHPDPSPAQTPSLPNIIVILTDDMRYDDLQYMTETNTLLANKGMLFENAFVSNALCCPSRATIMRGQYAHNTGVWTNVNGPSGGWLGYQSRGYEDDNVATNLDNAGYRTGLFGKYLNQYSGEGDVPLGWDDWFAFLQPIRYYDYDVNDNGRTRHFGTNASSYSTDVLSAETQKFIDASVRKRKPFFAYIAPKAPHGPFSTVPRHETDFDGATAPQSPSFDEEDVSDKPSWIQRLRRLTSDDIADINNTYERRLESLQSVDDLVAAVVTKLESRGVLDNTYIVFTSDNGWFRGEHRIRDGKARPYEEAPHVPLVIRGPGVQAGSSADELVLNTDYLPTFMDLAGVDTPSYVDGRSLLPVLGGSATSWRTAILLEGRAGNDPEIPVDRNYNGIRTSTTKYTEYQGGPETEGFRELYDFDPTHILPTYDPSQYDPDELSNIYYSGGDPNKPPLSDLSVLDSRLDALRSCQPEDDQQTTDVVEIPCQRAEDGS